MSAGGGERNAALLSTEKKCLLTPATIICVLQGRNKQMEAKANGRFTGRLEIWSCLKCFARNKLSQDSRNQSWPKRKQLHFSDSTTSALALPPNWAVIKGKTTKNKECSTITGKETNKIYEIELSNDIRRRYIYNDPIMFSSTCLDQKVKKIGSRLQSGASNLHNMPFYWKKKI